MHEHSDGELLRIAGGDAAAFAVFYDRYASVVFNVIRRIVRDEGDAEDVVQDVFLQVWHQAGRYDGSRGTVAAWLFTIARSRALDTLRRRGSSREEPFASDLARFAAPEGERRVLTREWQVRVRQALRELPVYQRRAVQLALLEELTHSEIAARTAQPLGTVKTRLRLALTKLRGALRERATEAELAASIGSERERASARARPGV